MMTMEGVHPAQAGIASTHAATLIGDTGARVRGSRLTRLGARSWHRLIQALHDSRQLEGARVLARYRHLMWDSD